MLKSIVCSVLPIFLFFSCAEKKTEANSIVFNATIWTGNTENEFAEAMALNADTILAIGTKAEVMKLQGSSTELTDLKGKFVVPGFIDSHVHLLMGGNSLLSVELRDAKTKEDFISRIADHVKTIDKNEWIVEGNWDHTLWGGTLPEKEWIDEFTKDHPVAVYRIDGHMILANSAALKIADIDKHTPEVENGEIVRHANGDPTGILKSEAMYLVLNKIPALNEEQKQLAINKAEDYLVSRGVTSVHDVDSLGGFSILKKMQEAGKMKIRVYSAEPLYNWEKLTPENRINSKWLKNGLVKGFMDGSLGSHTASFSEPYNDKPEDNGILLYENQEINNWVTKADEQNLHIAVHAIGDNANKTLLDMYENLQGESAQKDRRLRIEHAQHLAPEDIDRFADQHVIASVQPYHAIDDGRWAEELIGHERAQTTYAFKSLMNSGAKVIFGSDWPVAPASPLLGIYAAVTRRTTDDKNPDGWIPEQRITVEQALESYTKNAAFGSFEENIKGTLEKGKLADFVVLSADLMKIHPTEIKNAQVIRTYIGGKIMYSNNQLGERSK